MEMGFILDASNSDTQIWHWEWNWAGIIDRTGINPGLYWKGLRKELITG